MTKEHLCPVGTCRFWSSIPVRSKNFSELREKKDQQAAKEAKKQQKKLEEDKEAAESKQKKEEEKSKCNANANAKTESKKKKKGTSHITLEKSMWSGWQVSILLQE